VGENGVAAYGVIMYVNFVFLAIFIGYSMGSAPIVSYHFGAKNQSEMQNLYRKSLRIILTLGVSITILAELLAHPLSWIFVGFDQELFLFTRRAFMIFSLSFLLAGFNVYASAFFTALNNGLVSAGISFSRTLVFECGAVMLLPLLFGIDGIWSSVVVAEGIGVVLSVTMLCVFRKKYGY
jgi:Na+-driven multidrug efflux pump